VIRAASLVASAVLLAACRGGGGAGDTPPDAGESPQAKAEPAPLENAFPSSTLAVAADAGPPPVPMRADEELAEDTSPHEAPAWELDAVLRTADVPPAFRGPETAIVAVDAAKKKTEPRLAIDLTPSRMRMELANRAFPVPAGTELRARVDRYGHVVLLPGGHEYRVAAPGSLRSLFDDRRIDVDPLVAPAVVPRGDGAHRLGYPTRRVDVVSRVATGTFELARVDGLGEGGELVCRTLLDLMNAPPSTPVCGLDEAPLHVEIKWATKGSFVFDASELSRRAEALSSALAVPPAGYAFSLPALPPLPSDLLLDAPEVTAFRSAPTDVPQAPDAGARTLATGLTLASQSDLTRVAYLDGVPVAWVSPGAHLAMPWLLRGRYGFEWRTFLGDAYDAPTTINVPSTQTAGAAPSDGGAAP
jgi:hypothetical protein